MNEMDWDYLLPNKFDVFEVSYIFQDRTENLVSELDDNWVNFKQTWSACTQ